MIPNTPAPICDACKQPIDAAKGMISLIPLRGGLTLVVDNGKGNAGKVIDQRVDFCDATCVQDYLKQFSEKIVVPPAPAAAAKPAA